MATTNWIKSIKYCIIAYTNHELHSYEIQLTEMHEIYVQVPDRLLSNQIGWILLSSEKFVFFPLQIG